MQAVTTAYVTAIFMQAVFVVVLVITLRDYNLAATN